MKTARLVLVGLTAATLLGFSGTATAAGGGAGAARPQASPSGQHATKIRYLSYRHMAPSGTVVHIRGQVASRAQGVAGALPAVTVKLYREFNSGAWVYLASQPTGGGAFPKFDFATVARMDARYKVVFAGNDGFQGSAGVTWVAVYRSFHAVITDGSGAARLHGNVSPFYTHKTIYLEKRSCAACDYVPVERATTGADGAYSFSLSAPPSGRWWWRVSTPGNGAFMPSYSGTYTTQLVS